MVFYGILGLYVLTMLLQSVFKHTIAVTHHHRRLLPGKAPWSAKPHHNMRMR